MSVERFRENSRNLFPISRGALEQAFPYSTDKDSVQRAILRETVEMHQSNPHLFDHFKDMFRQSYQEASSLELGKFVDGTKLMYRVLRHQTPLPVISPNVLFTYDMENRREITEKGKGVKEYFVNKWMEKFQGKPEHAELAKTITKVGEIRTNNKIEEIWGGAYYVATVFERQMNVNEANKTFQNEARHMRKIFPNYFTDK